MEFPCGVTSAVRNLSRAVSSPIDVVGDNRRDTVASAPVFRIGLRRATGTRIHLTARKARSA